MKRQCANPGGGGSWDMVPAPRSQAWHTSIGGLVLFFRMMVMLMPTTRCQDNSRFCFCKFCSHRFVVTLFITTK